MRYRNIPVRKCLNKGPVLPMMLTINPVYKLVDLLTTPLAGIEAFTRVYLRTMVENGYTSHR